MNLVEQHCPPARAQVALFSNGVLSVGRLVAGTTTSVHRVAAYTSMVVPTKGVVVTPDPGFPHPRSDRPIGLKAGSRLGCSAC